MSTARKTTAAKSAPKTAPKRTAAKPKPAPAAPEPKLHGMTKAERRKAAQSIAKMRRDGIAWDTPETGVCAVVGVRTALVGRALLREFEQGDLIAPLTGSRAK
jgi:hypothetical protein